MRLLLHVNRMDETEFKVFTLNCWGIPLVSKARKARMEAIAMALSTGGYDFICLQEVWSNSDFKYIRDKIASIYVYSHYFHSGVIGSGVCVFSKYPLQDVFFRQWTVNGYIHKFQHMDWFGGKGVGLCHIRVNNHKINIYTAHLHAEYNRTNDEYLAHRVIQAFDTAQFIHLTSASADLIILAGDFNTQPGDLLYRVLVSMNGLRDAFNETNTNKELLYTNETPMNSFTSASAIKNKTPGVRIDYIMYSAGSNVNVVLKHLGNPLPHRVPNCDYSYSDHEAVTATLAIIHHKSDQKYIVNAVDKADVLKDCIAVCDVALKHLHFQKRIYWFVSGMLLVLLAFVAACDVPYNWKVLHQVFKVLITVVMCYTIIMATIWNMIETNAIRAGKLTMKLKLGQCFNERNDCS